MIHIIKLITDEWKPFRLAHTTAVARAKLIMAAESKLFFCGPLIYPEEAAAICERHNQGSLKEWAIYLNGPGQNEVHLKALNMLIGKITFNSCQNWWKVGILLTDKEGVIYNPEEDGKFNALHLDCAEAQALMQSIFERRSESEEKPSTDTAEEPPLKIEADNPKMVQLIKDQIDKCEKKLNADKLFRYVDENFQFVEVESRGMNLTQKRISLKSNLFRFRNKEAEQRFNATFKIFNKDDRSSAYIKEFKPLEHFKDEISKIKGEYAHSLGPYGTCIANKNVDAFSKAINEIRGNKLKETKESIRKHLNDRLEKCRKALREIIQSFHKKGLIVPSEKLKRDYQKSLSGDAHDQEERFIADVMASLSIPSGDEIAEGMGIHTIYKRVSKELCKDDAFLDVLQRKFRFRLPKD